MQELQNFFSEMESGLGSIAQSFVSIIEYLLFFSALILAVTMLITERRGDNIGFNAGRWALIVFIAGVSIALAKEVFGIA
ncbi:hypothetical protein [Croceivirga sp. JEA036]|uniref:hypothetical protein n=1 Tax=Croceivirga sp. JEA036 TaxID=2721162 RepID=UPI00143C4A84|nr:hypothetical protein [Croceivirga sp. JEA036]NJB38091.1 hypothetical protein [Croceivirga sp. JEA036]